MDNIKQIDSKWWKGKKVYFQDKGKPKKYALTKVYRVTSRGEILGHIKWFNPWKEYCFFSEDIILDKVSMSEILEFMSDRTAAQRAGITKQSVVDWNLVDTWQDNLKEDGRGKTIWTKEENDERKVSV